MKKSLAVTAVVTAVIAAAVLFYPRSKPSRTTLRLYAGAGLRPAVEKCIAAFEVKTGTHIEADYGGSGLIIARAREDKTADLFLPGDAWYVDRLDSLSGSVAERAAVAYFIPTLIVARGNPKGITGLKDLERKDISIGLGDTGSCQIGRLSAKILRKAGIAPSTFQQSLTVNELGVWVRMKTVDVAIVWNATAVPIAEDADTIPIAKEYRIISEVVLARLKQSPHPKEAKQFLAFIAGDEGREIFRFSGYSVTRPD